MSVSPVNLRRQTLLRSLFPHLGAPALYTLLAVLVTWPLAAHFTTGVVGKISGVDAFQGAWNLWWVAHALTHGQSPFYTHLLFYPHGIDLFWQTLQFSHGVFALPVTLLLGPLAAFNFTVLVSFVVGGYATFLFARHLTDNAPAALVAGAVYAFSPFHIERTIEGPLEITAVHWIPCYIFAFHVLLERPALWRALLSGGLLLWVSLGGWYYGFFCVLYTGCAILMWIPGRERKHSVSLALWGAAPLLIWGLVLASRILGLSLAGDVLGDLRDMQAARSADLLDFFLPNPVHPLWGAAVRDWRETIYPDAIIWNVALGWVGLLLGGLGSVATWRRSWRWTVLLAAALVLALGPSLRIGGYQTGLPLPFMLLQDLPGIRAAQRPSHMAVIGMLMLALLAAYGFAWLTRRLPVRRRSWLALGLVGAVVAIDGYGGPLRIVQREVHPFYATLPEPDGALMPLPLYYNINRSENLTPQTVHEWPILAGYVARPPAYPFGEYTPGVRQLQFGEPGEPDDIIQPGWPELGRQALAAYQIRFVTLDLTSDKARYFEQVRPIIRDLGLGEPLVADATLEAYAVPRTWPVRPVGFLGPGWQPLERQDAYRWRWIGEQAEIWLYNPLDRPVAGTITFQVSSYQDERMLRLALDGVTLGQIPVTAEGIATEEVRLLLSPGEHTFGLGAQATPDPQRNGVPISVRFLMIDIGFER